MSETLSFWNQQFQFSKILPDFMDHLALLDRQAEDWMQGRVLNKITYGEDPRQWVEMGEGTGEGSIVPFFIHGGYWRALTAEGHRAVLKGLSHLGPCFFNAEYRLIPTVTIQQLMQDALDGVSAAMAALKPDQKLLIIGHSAGAHLATHVALAHENQDRIAGFVSLSGLFDATPISLSFLQSELSLEAQDLEDMNLKQKAKGLSVPGLMVVGDDETYEFHRQAQLFADLSGCGITRVKEAHHMSLLQSLHEPESALIETISKFLNNQQPDPVIEGV